MTARCGQHILGRRLMSLQAKLDAFKADFESGKPPCNAPRPVIEIMHRATAELIATGAASRTKMAGDIAPSAKSPNGEVLNCGELLRRGPLILTFYRGTWCPCCNMELQALSSSKGAIRQIRRLAYHDFTTSRDRGQSAAFLPRSLGWRRRHLFDRATCRRLDRLHRADRSESGRPDGAFARRPRLVSRNSGRICCAS
jgi:hypothetical protein